MYSLWRRFTLIILVFVFFLNLSSLVYATHNKAVALVNEAKSLIETGDLKEAFLKLKAATREDDLYAAPYYYLAKVHFLKGDYQYALNAIEKAIKLKPHEELFKKEKYRIKFQEAINSPDKEELLEKIIAEYPRFLKPYFELFKIYVFNNEKNKIKELLNKLRDISAKGLVHLNSYQTHFISVLKAYLYFLDRKYILAYRKIREVPSSVFQKDPFLKKIYKVVTGPKNKPVQLIKKGDKALLEKNYLEAETYYKEAQEVADEKNYLEQKLNLIANIKAANNQLKKAINLLKKKKISQAERVLDNCEQNVLPMLENQEIYMKKIKKIRNYIANYKARLDKLQKRKMELKEVLANLKTKLKEAKKYFEVGEYYKAKEKIEEIDALVTKKEYREVVKFLEPDYTNLKQELESLSQILQKYKETKELYLNGKYEKALPVFLKLKENKFLSKIKEIDKIIGICYYLKGDRQKALEYLQDYLLKLKEPDIEALYYCGIIYQADKKYKEALSVFEQIMAKDSSYKDVPMRIKDIKIFMDAVAKKKLFTKIALGLGGVIILIFLIVYLKTYPKRKEKKLKQRAREYVMRRNWDKAIKVLDKLILLDLDKRELAQYQFYMAQAFFNKGNYQRARQFCESAMKNNYALKGVDKLYVNILMALHDTSPAAMEKYEYYYKNHPDDKKVIELMAKYYVQNEMYDVDATEILKKYLSFKPEDKAAKYHLVMAYLDQSSFDKEAVPYYEEGLKVLKENKKKRALYLLVKAAYEHEMWDVIWKHKDKIMEFFAENEEIQSILLQSGVNIGKGQELGKLYLAVLKQTPDNSVIKRMQKRLREQIIDI